MAEKETKITIDVWGTKKPEGEVDKAKATKDAAAPPAAEGEVEGHWYHHHHHWHGGGPFWQVGIGVGGGGGGGWTRCWNCGSVRFVRDAYPGQVFICGNCGASYTPY